MNDTMPSDFELNLEKLLGKLDRWLIQQPEWVLLFNANRAQRRRLGKELADHITTIPTSTDSVVPRALRRRLFREFAKQA